MSDFFQNGVLTTLHRLGPQSLDAIEERLREHADSNPTALVIPSLISELDRPALAGIVEQLAGVDYLEQIVIALGRADCDQYRRAREFFAPLGERCAVLWIESPRVQNLIRQLGESEVDIGPPGKGRASWLAFGYVMATERSRVIALHDADIVSYDRLLLARLCYPLMDPSLGYEYAKGYYSRITDQLHGRVTRLFLTPLVRSLIQMVGSIPFLRYLDSFRYALAGEFAIHVDLARSVRIPGDWGLEVGTLAEVYRNTSLRRICQVDIADQYEHKHQGLSPEDATAGLNRMAGDIAKSILRTLATEGIAYGAGFFRTLKVLYLRTAQDSVRAYHDDAVINHLQFDRHAEALAVEVFTHALGRACEEFETDPLSSPGLPNWNRVTAAIPDFLDNFREAVGAGDS